VKAEQARRAKFIPTTNVPQRKKDFPKSPRQPDICLQVRRTLQSTLMYDPIFPLL